MQHYHMLMFGCIRPLHRMPAADDTIEVIHDWMEALEARGYRLDWASDHRILGETTNEADADVLGLVLASSHPHLRIVTDADVAGLQMTNEVTPATLLAMAERYAEAITQAERSWIAIRFAARGIGLDLPPGTLYLVQGRFDT